MTRTFITAAIAAAALAAPAMANDQLARAAGVAPGVYSTADLSLMIQAIEEGDDVLYRSIEERGGEIVSSQSPAAGAGSAQLARSVGAAPGVYSTAELSLMRQALEEGDEALYRSIRAGGGELVSSQSPLSGWGTGADGAVPAVGTASVGKSQIARALGVDADDYTLAELSRMFIDAND